MTDSSTGGPLLPTNDFPAPLQGQALNRFLQQWVVALTGLPGEFVKPRWLADPSSMPDAGEAWAAIGVTVRPSDHFPAVIHDGTGEGRDVLIRHEKLALMCSFYDLGSNGLADQYCAILRDGASIAQNWEYLEAQGFKVTNTDEPIAVPVLLKMRWQYRVDMVINLRRVVKRAYAVLNLKRVQATVVTESGDDTFTRAVDTGVVS